MQYWTSLRLKIIDFCKRNKKKIFVVLIIWLIIIAINYILKNKPEKLPTPSTTYKPHVSVMNEEKEVPQKYQASIETLVDTYFKYCNNGEYENAYNLITEECKKNVYPTLEEFTGYVKYVFEGKKKIYNIQSYSIVENKYIYNIRILDDILANGTTDGYYYYEEKIILIEENGKMKLSIGEFIGTETTNTIAEDDNLIIEIVSKSIDYETETYTIKFTNKTENYIVISDNTQDNEIVLDLGTDKRKPINMAIATLHLNPGSSITQNIQFNKFYDETSTANSIIFGSIRILKDYNWKQGTTQQNLDSAIKLYGLQVNL